MPLGAIKAVLRLSQSSRRSPLLEDGFPFPGLHGDFADRHAGFRDVHFGHIALCAVPLLSPVLWHTCDHDIPLLLSSATDSRFTYTRGRPMRLPFARAALMPAVTR